MGRFSELDLELHHDLNEMPEDLSDWVPTNEAEEAALAMQAIHSDLSTAEKELTDLLYRWKYYGEAPPREDLDRILSYITAARRTLS